MRKPRLLFPALVQSWRVISHVVWKVLFPARHTITSQFFVRHQYIIYPWYYGIETLDLYGEPVTWVCPELERRISEALAVDERITGVTDFEFDLTVKGVVHAYFTVKTIYGDIKAEKGVKI